MTAMPTAHQFRPVILALALVAGWCAAASAQSYPAKPIRIVVPFAAGGITDVIARAHPHGVGEMG